jgi:hypothetical protein
MPDLNLFRRKKTRPMTDLEASIANGVSQSMAGQQSNIVQQQKELAEDALLITDPNTTSFLQGMSRFSWVDSNGVMGAAGQVYEGATPKNVAIALANSHLIRTGWTEQSEANIMIWEAHRLFTKNKMLMTEEEYEEGGALVMDADYGLVKMNILCSKNGRLAKLVKSRPHSIDVTVGGPAGKEGFGR